jgi:uncharacterized protein
MQKMKRIVIDGHNLIPKVPGIRLQDVEDENALVEILNEYCRLSRTQVEVFFDGAPIPDSSPRKSGLAHVHFIRKGLTADDAIIEYVRNQQRPDFMLTVVSSDYRILTAVKGAGASIMTSEAFAIEMRRVFSSPAAQQEQKEKRMSDNEIQQWLEEFESGQSRQDNS